MPALDGVRVLELAEGVAAAFAGRLLAQYGAAVTKVEPRGGDPARHACVAAPVEPGDTSSLHRFLNLGKTIVAFDDRPGAGRGFDVVLTDWADERLRGTGLAREEAVRPAVVQLLPFGASGPYAGWRTTSLVSFAMGGQMSLTGEPHEPPKKTYGYQPEYQLGLHGFAATAAALLREGVPAWVEVSGMEAQASALQQHGPIAYQHRLAIPRLGNVTAPTWGMFEAAGGYVSFVALPGNYPTVARLLGLSPEEAEHLLAVDGDVPVHADALEATVRAWCFGHTPVDAHRVAGETGAPVAAVLTVPQLFEWPGLVEKGFWERVDGAIFPGAGARFQAGPGAAPPPSPAPRQGVLPLEGVRVLDLSLVWSAPYAGALLAEAGADVIKIEGPATFDVARILAPVTADERAARYSPYFKQHNRGKRSLAVDLKAPEGRDLFLRLVRESDVVLENYRAGVLERLGLGWDVLHATNRQLVACSMPGFGSTGSEAARAAYGPIVEAMSGLASLGGVEGGPPLASGVSYGDPLAGTVAAGVIMLGLIQRKRTGEGVRIELAQRDNMLSMIGEVFVEYSRSGRLPPRLGNRHPEWAPQGCYPALPRDQATAPPILGSNEPMLDRWLALSVTSDAEWAALSGVIGRDDLAGDPGLATATGRRERHDAIDAAIAAWSSTLAPEDAAARLQAAGVPAGPVLHPTDLHTDPHMAVRGFLGTLVHPSMGAHTMSAPLWRFADAPAAWHRRAAPLLGEHTDEVLGEVLGMTAGEVEALRERGVVG